MKYAAESLRVVQFFGSQNHLLCKEVEDKLEGANATCQRSASIGEELMLGIP
jgi:hypothetical protein